MSLDLRKVVHLYNDDDYDRHDDHDDNDDDDDDDCPPVPELVRSSIVILANSRNPRVDDLATVHELHRCLPGGKLLSTRWFSQRFLNICENEECKKIT